MTARRRAPRAAAVLVILGTIAACGGGKAKSAATTSRTDFSSTLPLTTAGASSTSASTTSTTAPASCTAPARPATAIRVSQAAGDFDGDGNPDQLVVYGTGTNDAPAPYVVRIDLGAGHGSVETTIVDAATDPNQNVKALGGSDVSARPGRDDGSGAEAFVAVGSGASTFLVGLYQLTACHLVRLASAGGSTPAELPVGGTVTHLSGVRCDSASGAARLVQVSAESTDGVTYTTSEQPFDVTDGKLVPAGPPVARTLDANDPDLSRFSGLDCSGVSPI